MARIGFGGRSEGSTAGSRARPRRAISPDHGCHPYIQPAAGPAAEPTLTSDTKEIDSFDAHTPNNIIMRTI